MNKSPLAWLAAAALSSSISTTAFADTPVYTFETPEWVFQWQDFNFGVSSWGQGGVTLTGGVGYTGPYFNNGNFTALGNNETWGSVSAGGSGPLTDSSTTGTTFSLMAQPGWMITGLGIRATGNYATLGTGASVSPNISLQVTSPGALTSTNFVAGLNLTLGTWSVDTGAIGGAAPFTSLSFSIQQNVSVDSLSEGASSSGDMNGIQFYWTAAPVPEPSEWAMMAAGLGIVGLIVRRRRRVEG